MSVRETPKFTGITIYRDPKGRFTIRHPSDWHTYEIKDDVTASEVAAGDDAPQEKDERVAGDERVAEDEWTGSSVLATREGFGFTPTSGDPQTAFTIWVSPLDEKVVAEDLDELKAGVDAGLQALSDCHVEAASETVLGNLIKFERIYSFREPTEGDGAWAVRKRKQWLLYVDQWLMCLTWQGSSPEEYQYWFAMANYSFLTFELPEALWFATDRDLNKPPAAS